MGAMVPVEVGAVSDAAEKILALALEELASNPDIWKFPT
jgi:hypothetical protein